MFSEVLPIWSVCSVGTAVYLCLEFRKLHLLSEVVFQGVLNLKRQIEEIRMTRFTEFFHCLIIQIEEFRSDVEFIYALPEGYFKLIVGYAAAAVKHERHIRSRIYLLQPFYIQLGRFLVKAVGAAYFNPRPPCGGRLLKFESLFGFSNNSCMVIRFFAAPSFLL